MEGLSLRGYQHDCIKKVGKSIREHERSILCAQTGSGKTRMAKWMLGRYAEQKPKSHCAFLVERRGLVYNASDSFLNTEGDQPPLDHAIIMSGTGGINWKMKTHVCSIDTMNSWFLDDRGVYCQDTTYDFLVADEIHTGTTKYIRFAEANNARRRYLGLPPAPILGLSATPQNKSLTWFNDIVYGPAVKELQELGYLCKYRYVVGRATADRSKLKKNAGEFTASSVGEAFEDLEGDMVRDYKRFLAGRPTIAFFPRLKEAEKAVAEYKKHGIHAVYLSGETPDEERKLMYDNFQNGVVEVICNVGVTERGTDLPACKGIQLCTSIGRISRYRQMIGRGCRPHPNFGECIVLDHGGNIVKPNGDPNHGLFEDEIPWSLTDYKIANEPNKERKTVQCPKCNEVYRGGKCPNCGHEPPVKEKPAKEEKEFNKQQMEFLEVDGLKRRIKSSEEIMKDAIGLAANMRFGKNAPTVRQAVAIAIKAAPKAGNNNNSFEVPKYVEHNEKKWKIPAPWEPDSRMPVHVVFPWAKRKKKK